MAQRTRSWLIVPWMICLAFVAGCDSTSAVDATNTPLPGAAPAGDYGDAPEGGQTGYPGLFAQVGSFPTTFASNGARTLRVDEARLGTTASTEVDATDPADSDGVPNLTNADSDDGLVDFFITLTAIPPPTTLSVVVVGPAGSAGGTFYVNAIIDLNMDGEWGGQGANGELEWVVQNQPVQVSAGSTTRFTSPPFAFSNGNLLPDGAYMRLALTRERVPPNWDGTGEFSSGEIEDHVIRLPELDGKNIPILTVDCNGPYAPGAVVTCNVTNHRNVAGAFTYSLSKVAGGTVNVPIATCAPGGPGGGPVPIGPNATVAITCASTPGTTPTTWRFTAKVDDPAAEVVEGGIRLGHSDESTADFDFEGEAKLWAVYLGGILGFYEHFQGFSEVLAEILIFGDDPVPMEGADVTLQITRPDGSTEMQSVTTGPDGKALVKFTIFVFGDYTVSILNIEGEAMEYHPELNVVDSIEIEVGPGESTPLGIYLLDPAVEAFIEIYNSAFEAGDVEALLSRLHPAVLDVYGATACQSYLEGVIENPIRLEVRSVTGFGVWLWEIDGTMTDIQDTYSIQVDLTVQGQTVQREIHLAVLEDGTIGWFTDCGDPLP